MRQIAAQELAEWLADGTRARPQLLDVREAWEVATCRIPDSAHVPMREIPARFAELDPERDLVVICHHGSRSMQVAYFLNHNGFSRVYNLSGGVDAWARTVDSSMPTY